MIFFPLIGAATSYTFYEIVAYGSWIVVIFVIFVIRCYLQLLWDPEKNIIYEDCAVNAYGPNREFMPIMENVEINLHPDSNIVLSVHAD